MDRPMSNFHFKFMSFCFRFRDILLPPEHILEETGIKPCFYILDYGCGPGSYSITAAELVGKSGKVYALDLNPLAVQRVQDIASKKGLINIEGICSNCATKLPDDCINVVLLYDTFHDLSEQNRVLKELHRVLRPDGILSFMDHHMEEDEIISKVTDTGLFKLSRKGERTYSFLKEE